MTPPVALTIAGSDSGGGAGIAADLTTFAALGVHGTCVIAAVTAQDTTAVHQIQPLPEAVIAAQLDAVLGDFPVAAVKTGLLGSVAAVELVAQRVGALPLVVDPVLGATSGASFATDAVIDAYRRELLPRASVVTPNADEAAALGELNVPVIRTGSASAVDLLQRPGREPVELAHDVVQTGNDHGSGCTYSAALTAFLAHGHNLETSAAEAAEFTATQLRNSSGWRLGAGRGPVSHISPSTPGVTT
ncbi:MAG: hydroxymethylpyrimidine/phosphomethylpyrimidine kinase [Solirubrobacterales bacterium]|nr:hydroxymethylpyrimidine/phosphomethylpyrimidine kinase [Solirubrobacterales bacterium]